MELTGDIGRGHDDHEGVFARLDLGGEVAAFFPELVYAGLDVGGVVGARDIGAGALVRSLVVSCLLPSG